MEIEGLQCIVCQKQARELSDDKEPLCREHFLGWRRAKYGGNARKQGFNRFRLTTPDYSWEKERSDQANNQVRVRERLQLDGFL